MFGADQIPCLCGSLAPYGGCCGRLHRGSGQAATALDLMRSRYAAYAVGDAGYLWRTWHPRTRPGSIELDADLTWTGLDVHGAGSADDGDWVEFTASYLTRTGAGDLHEHSRFTQRAGRWFYLDGELR